MEINDENATSSSDAAADPFQCPAETRTSPVVVLVVGMAGAGKTTLMHRINLEMIEKKKRAYYVNLDPACASVPFSANIDIRDTVNYKEVMKQYGLGPNGGILTALNLFATRFDQVISLLEKRADELDYIFVDTPGQIEAFTWSAGGQIIHDLLGTSFPTTIMYIVDTPRCDSPSTFMSNMLYACSVLYKSRLPMVLAFNKVDAAPCDNVMAWMDDYELYQETLQDDSEGYMNSLNSSLALVLDEFYSNIRRVGVSAATAEGIPELLEKFDEAAAEFQEVYLPDLKLRFAQQKRNQEVKRAMELAKLEKDIDETRGERLVSGLGPARGRSSEQNDDK